MVPMARVDAISGRVARRRGAGALLICADRHIGWLLVAPAVVLILALTIYPLGFSVWVAFVNYDFQVPGHAFVGLQNFEYVVEDPIARRSIADDCDPLGFQRLAGVLLGLGLAMAMSKTFAGRGIIMLILIVPLFVSPVVVGQIWSLILQKPYGPFDYLVSQLFGPTQVSWLTGNPWKFVSLIAADVWQWTPFMFVILLAGLNLGLARALRGGGAGRCLALADLLEHHPAADRALDPDRRHLPTAGCREAVRHHLHHDRRRPGDEHLHDLLLPLPNWIPELPPGAGHRGELAVPHPHGGADHVSGPANAASGARLMPSRKRRRRQGALSFDNLVRVVYLGLFLAFLLGPLYWTVITSIKPIDDFMNIPPVWFPDQPTLLHYRAAMFTYRGLAGLTNSAIVSTAATVLSVLLGTFMGYSFARFNTGGQHLSFWVLSQRFLPPVAVVLPVFLLYRSYGLNDTRFGLVLIYTVMTLPLSAWMMFAYFRQMPGELEEAALVDGYSRWGALWRVALPLALPGIVAAAVFAFIFVGPNSSSP